MTTVHSVDFCLDWAVAFEPFPGEQVCGDVHVFTPFRGGVLLGVIDGVGHGSEAALAARRAVASLERSGAETLADAVTTCHKDLRQTRGAAFSLVAIHPKADALSGVAVGNVEMVLHRASRTAGPARETIVPRAGIVGHRLPPLRETTMTITANDVLILASDGILSRFTEYVPGTETSQTIAEAILRTYCRQNDDALVLVARYLGGCHE
jgi:phosphoserine phosphatase RsbX